MNDQRRPSRAEWALALAVETAKRSTCLRRQVGCVLLNARGHVLATGYNGVAAGMPHCNEGHQTTERIEALGVWSPGPLVYPHACPAAHALSGTQLEGCEAIHAEQNALLQCRDVWEIDSCYCTTAPCLTCLKLLLNTGCRLIVSDSIYPHEEKARELWERAGREWKKLAVSA